MAADPDAPVAGQRRGRAVEAFRHKNYALFWTGALVSNVGTWMQNATIPYVLYIKTGRASWVGFATFAQFFPSVILGPVGGSLADRFSRRTVLLITQSSSAAVAMLLWALWVSGVAGPLVLVALVAVGGVVSGLMIPSWQAFVTELVPREVMLNAVTLNSAQFNASRALGPMIGGYVLGRFGPSWSFLANAMSFAAVVGALVLIKIPPVGREPVRSGIVSGFIAGYRYMRRQASMSRAIAMVFTVAFLGNPIVPLAAVLTRRVYDVGAREYGLMTGAFGAGAVVGALVLGTYGHRVARSRLLARSMVGYAAALLLLGMSRTFGFGLVAMFVAGGGYLAIVSTLNTTVQLLVAEEMRGRVIAMYVMAFTSGFPLGSLLQGWLSDQIGAPTTIVMAASALLVIGMTLSLVPRLMRGFDASDSESDEGRLVVPSPTDVAE